MARLLVDAEQYVAARRLWQVALDASTRLRDTQEAELARLLKEQKVEKPTIEMLLGARERMAQIFALTLSIARVKRRLEIGNASQRRLEEFLEPARPFAR